MYVDFCFFENFRFFLYKCYCFKSTYISFVSQILSIKQKYNFQENIGEYIRKNFVYL